MITPNRSFFTRQRRQLSPSKRRYHAMRANLHLPRLHTLLPKNANIALYQDDFGELPTFGIVQFCQAYGYTPHLPVVQDNKLVFTPIISHPKSQFPFVKLAKKRHRLGMYEPINPIRHHINTMHACFCPLVAMDYQGNRMGMGGGFYDRTLQHYHGLKIGWCYDFQLTPTIAVNAWDVAMDMAICPSRLWRF